MDCISEQVGSRRELDSETTIWLLQLCALCPARHQASCHIIQVATAAEPALVSSPNKLPLRPAEGCQKASGDSFRLITEGVGAEHRCFLKAYYVLGSGKQTETNTISAFPRIFIPSFKNNYLFFFLMPTRHEHWQADLPLQNGKLLMSRIWGHSPARSPPSFVAWAHLTSVSSYISTFPRQGSVSSSVNWGNDSPTRCLCVVNAHWLVTDLLFS